MVPPLTDPERAAFAAARENEALPLHRAKKAQAPPQAKKKRSEREKPSVREKSAKRTAAPGGFFLRLFS